MNSAEGSTVAAFVNTSVDEKAKSSPTVILENPSAPERTVTSSTVTTTPTQTSATNTLKEESPTPILTKAETLISPPKNPEKLSTTVKTEEFRTRTVSATFSTVAVATPPPAAAAAAATKAEQNASQTTNNPRRSTSFPRPCRAHKPTLEELQSQSFSDYIRYTVLTAALPSYEVNDDDSEFYDSDDEEDYTVHPMPLTEGIAKITLPYKFCNQTYAIGDDRTGRGPAWQKGSRLGDMLIHPMEQHCRGLAGIYEYSFLDRKQPVSLADFRIQADAYIKHSLGQRAFPKKKGSGKEPETPVSSSSTVAEESESKKTETEIAAENSYTDDRCAELESLFWKRLGPTMPPAWYGADQEGSIFHPDDEASGWSVAQLDSCLHVLPKVPGVTSPYLYAGMWASVFCAHSEDMDLFSINYLHAGAPKLWYAIAPGVDAKRFEVLCQAHYGGTPSASKCKEFLRHKRSLLSHKILQKAGIRYTTAIQRPGDAIITFPSGYHFGFNLGFNMAEATNFGVPEWIPYGRKAQVCLCRPDSVRIDMNGLTALLDLFDKETKYGKKMSWKKWAQTREQARQQRKKEEETARALTALATSNFPKKKKKKKLSEQEKKKEFWVEVVKPVAKKSGLPSKKKKQPKVEEIGRGKRKRKPSYKVALFEQELAEANAPKVVVKEIWHLAKPFGRRGAQVDDRILCFLPGTSTGWSNIPINVEPSSHSLKKRGNNHDEEDDDDEQCFKGEVVEVSDDHVRIHIDGLPRSEDVWMPAGSPKLYFDGGQWEEREDDHEIPARHYWKIVDSKRRCTHR